MEIRKMISHDGNLVDNLEDPTKPCRFGIAGFSLTAFAFVTEQVISELGKHLQLLEFG